MVDVAALIAKNAARWHAMHLHPERMAEFDATARRLCEPSAKARYQGVTDRLIELGLQPVPWEVIAVISEREYGGPPHWDKQLGQGDPLNHVSTHDPAGRGPFLHHDTDTTPGHDAWTRGCLDALIECGPYAAKWHDWSIGGILTLLEEYNGLGYAAMGVPSAYVWSGTDQYVSGKYIADHVYRASAVDVQEGCAPILARMMLLDTTIKIDGAFMVADAKTTPPDGGPQTNLDLDAPKPPAIELPPASTPVPTGKILDTNRNTYGKTDALKAAGYTTVIRYIAYALEHHEKVIKAGEARAIAAAGMKLGLVYEINGRPSGSMVGQRDGSYALTYAQTVGAPKGAIIWYTVDWDAGPGDMAWIRLAFRAFKQAIGSMYRTGCYGSGFVCNDLKANGLCDARWLTDSRGFRGTKEATAAGEYEMIQSLPQTVAGLDTDPDARHRLPDGTGADIGDFTPFAESVYSPPA